MKRIQNEWTVTQKTNGYKWRVNAGSRKEAIEKVIDGEGKSQTTMQRWPAESNPKSFKASRGAW